MRTRERVELSLIAVASVGALAAAPLVSLPVAIGTLVLAAAALLLGQGLLRDLSIKLGPQAPAKSSCSRAAFCAESGLGIAGIVAGAALLFSGSGGSFSPSRGQLALLFAGICVFGFFIKDVVLDLRTFRLRIEKDHRSVVIW